MRISDWSSDVCSSDLCDRLDDSPWRGHVQTACPEAHPQPLGVEPVEPSEGALHRRSAAGQAMRARQSGKVLSRRPGGVRRAGPWIAGQEADSPDGAGHRVCKGFPVAPVRSEEHTSELQSLMRISYAVFCL